MKFSLQNIAQCAGRIGTISEIERLPGLLMETPMLLVHTKGGVVSHLTHETLQMVTTESQALQLPVSSTLQCLHATSEFGKPLADFIGMKEYLTYCSLHDSAVSVPKGYNSKNQISVWTKAGREYVDADRYMDIMETFQPDIYQAICDGDTNRESTKKRVQKSLDITYDFFRTCLERQKLSKRLKHSSLLAVLEGGFSLEARGSAARMLAKVPVSGFVIDGLDANGRGGERLSMEIIQPLVKESIKYLPEGAFRVAPGCWSPEAVWQLIQLGIDVFDSSLPSILTERGSALVFHFNPETTSFTYDNSGESESTLHMANSSNSTEDASGSKEESTSLMEYEISLKDPKYRDCLEPLLATCECLTCKNHTKAYVHHLLITQELLAHVLLMIHNLHLYMDFFKKIRHAIKMSQSN